MKKRVITSFAVLFIAAITFAFEPPAENAETAVSFAQDNAKTFSRGLIYKNVETVRAAESGQSLIIISDSQSECSFPSSLGTAFIMIHDNNMITVYSNLEADSIPDNLVSVDIGTMIGKTGTSGYTGAGTLEFQISDRMHEKRINPQMLLPSDNDTAHPTINDVVLKNDKTLYQMSAKRLKQGNYTLYAAITDCKKTKSDFILAPFQITVTQNGHEIRNILFETLHEENGRLKMGEHQAARGFEEVYGENGICIGEIVLKRGKNELNITARDIIDNENTVNWSFSVD